MSEAADGLYEYLSDKTVNDPCVPVYSNFTAQPYAGDHKTLIKAQVENSVKWQTTVENLIAQGVDTFIEIGVGKTLIGLIKRINGDVKAFKVENKEDLENLEV